MQKIKSNHIETDPVLLITREKHYNIHKQKLAIIEKTIDNSSPFSVRFPKMSSKSPLKNHDLDFNNSRIYNKLNEIYHRPAQKHQVLTRTSKSLKRINENAKICLENEIIHKKLTSQKPTLSFKDLQKQFKEMSEIKEMISKFNRMLSSKKLMNTLKANNTLSRDAKAIT